MDTELLDVYGVAEIAGAKPDAIRYLVKRGQIPVGYRVGGRYGWTMTQARQIADWMAMRERLTGFAAASLGRTED